MDLQNEKCVMVIDENLPLGVIGICNQGDVHAADMTAIVENIFENG